MKKIMILLAALTLTFALVACGTSNDNTVTPTTAPTGTTAPTAVPTEVPTEAPTGAPEDNASAQETLDALREDIAAAYGDNYIPNMPYDEISLSELFGLDSSWYDGVVAEGPMISFNVDTLVMVHATEGNLENVQTALNAYHNYLVNDTIQYPMNLAKVQASTVETVGDYVCFVMLGVIDDSMMETATDAEMLAAWTEQNQIALNLIKEQLQ